jgi:hypothetical protein
VTVEGVRERVRASFPRTAPSPTGEFVPLEGYVLHTDASGEDRARLVITAYHAGLTGDGWEWRKKDGKQHLYVRKPVAADPMNVNTGPVPTFAWTMTATVTEEGVRKSYIKEAEPSEKSVLATVQAVKEMLTPLRAEVQALASLKELVMELLANRQHSPDSPQDRGGETEVPGRSPSPGRTEGNPPADVGRAPSEGGELSGREEPPSVGDVWRCPSWIGGRGYRV